LEDNIHARTVKQGFTGEVDYSLVKQIKNQVKIPVIASGDIDSPQKANEILDYTGCDALMVGRAARGAPWIFYDIQRHPGCYMKDNMGEQGGLRLSADNGNSVNKGHRAVIKNLSGGFVPSVNFKKSFAMLYLDFLVYFYGEEKAIRDFRKHFAWIFRKVKNISRYRQDFNFIRTLEEAGRLISGI
jgi:tRNA-dihydrouridine synthase B